MWEREVVLEAGGARGAALDGGEAWGGTAGLEEELHPWRLGACSPLSLQLQPSLFVLGQGRGTRLCGTSEEKVRCFSPHLSSPLSVVSLCC